MTKSPLDVVLCAWCGSNIPPESIFEEVWEEGDDPLFSFGCEVCGMELCDSEDPPATLRNLLDPKHFPEEIIEDVNLSLFSRGVVRQVELSRPLLPEQERLKSLLGNLLAVIHGDGGHYIEEHGWERACEEAEKRISMLRVNPE